MTSITQDAPRAYAGRIDELLETGAHLTEQDSHPDAQRLHEWARLALATREVARSYGRTPPAPLEWLPILDQLADWVGWK